MRMTKREKEKEREREREREKSTGNIKEILRKRERKERGK